MNMGRVVAWVSRHKPLPAQIRYLKRKLGNDVNVVQIPKTFTDVKEIYEDVVSAGADVAVVVLPLSMIACLVERYKDVVWLMAEMEPVHDSCPGVNCPYFDPDRDVILPGVVIRHMRFKKFVRVKEVRVVKEDW